MAVDLDFDPRAFVPEDFPDPARLHDAVKALVGSLGPEVTLSLALEEGAIALDLLKVEPDSRGRGLGRKAMKRLLALADRHRVPVRLHAMSLCRDEPGPDQQQLEEWYARLGFVRTGRHSVMGLAEMRRDAARHARREGLPSRKAHACVFRP
jgi:GNAT superfamily N-acetyltransferase